MRGCGIIDLLVRIDGKNVRQRLQDGVPARSIGGLPLVFFARHVRRIDGRGLLGSANG
jgi:hypothetical protein